MRVKWRSCAYAQKTEAKRKDFFRAIAAVAAVNTFTATYAVAQSDPASMAGPEHNWLKDNFSGPFTWNFIDLETGEVAATGRGDCEMAYGGLFLRCVHMTADGAELGVGISGFDNEKQKNQWTYYGAGSSAMLHGEGYRDADAGESYIEGRQKLAGMPEFTFRTVTKEMPDGTWLYSHYRLDGETPVEMFRATFDYRGAAKE